jgi:Protein of unknown function (DUF1094).
MSMAYEEYMREIARPMRKELTDIGFQELTTEEEVERFMDHLSGTAMIVVNSICGCAGGLARPAVREALSNPLLKPDHLVTVFAGQDREATAKMRSYFKNIPPSSPSIFFLDGRRVVQHIPREDIESSTVDIIAERIRSALSGLADRRSKN